MNAMQRKNVGMLASVLLHIRAIDPATARTRLFETDEECYAKRQQLIHGALGLAGALGYRHGIDIDTKAQDVRYPLVAYIDLPNIGQVSWHLPLYSQPWDGHSTDEKARRIGQYGVQAVLNLIGV